MPQGTVTKHIACKVPTLQIEWLNGLKASDRRSSGHDKERMTISGISYAL
jgi:hypothetical protein